MKTVWSHISSLIPKPEIEEVERIVGKRLIDGNEKLCDELNCLKAIVGDFLTHQFNRVDMNITRERHAPQKSSMYDSKEDVITFRSMEHIEDRTSECSSTALEIVESVKGYLSINKIHDVLDQIHQALENEKDELEAEIQLLQSSMDLESDILSRGSTPGSKNDTKCSGDGMFGASLRKELCSSCGARIDVLSSSIDLVSGSSGDIYCGPGRVRRVAAGSARGEKTSGSGICTVCRIGRQDSKQWDHSSSSSSSASRLSVHLDMKEVASALDRDARDQEQSSSRRPGTSGGGRSRIRNRIETARDERFFLDED